MHNVQLKMKSKKNERQKRIDMAIGFVLMHIIPGHEDEVYNKLSKVPRIIELHPLFGEYDLIVKYKR